MNTQERIGLVIKSLRVRQGLSQEQLGLQCGLDQHYLSNLENGRRNPSIEVLERIASFFGYSLSSFFSEVEAAEKKLFKPNDVLSVEEGFVRFMLNQGLSDRTIRKYSVDTPNSPSVQAIILSMTGTTEDMFHVCDLELLQRIVDRVSESDFDLVGHKMYSSGIKKFIAFIEDSRR